LQNCALCHCPACVFQLLIGFESGAIVLWDLKNKAADCRHQSPEVGSTVRAWTTDRTNETCDLHRTLVYNTN